MRNQVMWAIRDARGLSANEKVFLFTVESRGSMRTTQVNAAKDMGLSRATYYRVRDSLIGRDLLTVRRNMDSSTEYLVNEVSLSETDVSHTETVVSHTETDVSHSDNTKKNISKNSKKNMKKNNSASAPVEPKEDEEPSFEEVVQPLLDDEAFSLQDGQRTAEFDERTPADWREIRSQRPLTQQENDYINARATAYMAKKRAEEEAARKEEAW
jgi:hypothetical protein